MGDQPPLSDLLVSPLLHLLLVLHETAGGDLELHLILLVIAERSVAHPELRGMSNNDRISSEAPALPTRGVNIRSIAESTGMARETVRRKVAGLLRSGWITQTDEGLAVTSEGYRALNPAREEIERLALKYHDLVAQWTVRAGREGGATPSRTPRRS